MSTREDTGTEGDQLGTSLKPRHITMISIAGVIGAGLFVGSASAIKLAGPSVLIAYALAGTLVVLVMRMLGEMATVNPDTGSFSVYADRALGKWAGFSIGWLYWWAWALIIPVEATAGATILHNWIDWPQWVFAFLITAILTATNLVSVGNYGEFEFWFALIKVLAIAAFLVLGALIARPATFGRAMPFLFGIGGTLALIAVVIPIVLTAIGALLRAPRKSSAQDTH